MPLAMMVDLERCIGCRACEAACKLENRLTQGIYRNRVAWINPSGANGFRYLALNMLCQHCERPACLRACTTVPKAITRREDGIVLVEKARCVGCKECVKACPYGAMGFDFRTNKADKCTYCAHRVERGLEPACVAICPGRALSFGEKEVLLQRAEGRAVMDIDHFLQNPSTIYLGRMEPKPLGGLRRVETQKNI